MICPRYPQEVYDLHSIGVLEGEERETLGVHLREDCAYCTKAIARAHGLWTLTGAGIAQLGMEDELGPSPALRRRVLSLVEPVEARRRRMIPRWDLVRIAAGILLVVAASTLTWYLSGVRSAAELDDLRAELSRSQRALQRAETERQTSRPAPAPEPVSPAPAAPGGLTLSSDVALRRRLQELEQASAAATKELGEQTARLRQAEGELAEKTKLLAAAVREQQAADVRYQSALETARSQTADATQRNAQTTAYAARIRELERQVSTYRNIIQLQQQTVTENTRLASMLRSPSVSLVSLSSTQSGQGSRGVALIANNSIVFFASSLPTLRTGRSYQLWLLRDRSPAVASAGTFSVWGNNTASVQLTNAGLIPGITGLAVTEEPAGGSPLPSGNKLMVGTRKS